MTLDYETIVSALATFVGFLSLAFIPLVLLRRKEAPSAIAWILVLVFLPLVGVVLFWFLGRDRVRRPAREKRSTDTEVRSRLGGLALPPPRASLDRIILDEKPEQRGVMRLAAQVGHTDPVGGNDVRVLVGAPRTLDAIVEAIDAATDHVHLEYYIVRNDETGRRLRDALVRAAQRGVRVRMLLDAFGSPVGRRFTGPLLAAGGHVAKFFPLDPVRRAWTINLRNHRKLIVIDGRVGLAGGINVGDEFLDWHDLHLRVEGPAVAQLQAVFTEDWYFATRYDLAHPAFFPEIEPVAESVVQFVQSGPDATVESIHRLYFAAIASARERVYITTPYFVPDRALLVALQTAALRGVDVRLILPSWSNHGVTFHAGRSFYDELLGAGVRIHEYQEGFVHTKTMVVDGRFGTLGSANLDVRSFRLNFELIAVLWDPRVVGKLEDLFMEDLAHTKPVELDAWRQRSLVTRMKEGAGRLCAPLL